MEPQSSAQTPLQPTSDSHAPYPQPSPTSSGSVMFGGRLGRVDFFLGGIYLILPLLIAALLQVAAGFIFTTVVGSRPPAEIILNIITLLVGIVTALISIPVSISLYVRRFHDLNQSGWLTLLTLVPFVNFRVWLALLVLPGTAGVNNYGIPVRDHNIWVVLGFKRPRQV